MSYHEKKHIAAIISSVLIFGLYSLFVYNFYVGSAPEVINDLKFWGITFLILIPVSIAGRIIIHIIFSIINTIATREKEPSLTDERDKMIELKAARNAHWIFLVGFFLAMVAITAGYGVSAMFIIIALSGFLADIVSEVTQIRLYRRGF